MSYNWCDLPLVECPYCSASFELDDYHRCEEGDTFKCPECGMEICVLETDPTLSVRVGTFEEVA